MPIRLIDTTTLRMKVFVGSKIPAYAILSHTWVDDDEIDFQEMKTILRDPEHPATDKSGYEKIRATCSEAKRHGIRYAWVDTCCIDKSSSAELSEAINSMFAWYRNAEVCFVFLRDVGPNSNILTTLPHCRWMSRGWTLQELIAPRDLRFYNRAWEYVGSKMSLRQRICETTAINQEVLDDCDALSDIPVARRMSWASRRETTRVEDIAYCLLGIFDVNMPLLYGEGDKAFIRLQEEIIRRSDDLSIFCNFPGIESVDQPTRPSAGDARGMKYSDLLATSPKDFSVCHDVSRGEANRLIHTFSSTNVGVRFENVRVHVGQPIRNPDNRYFYTMDLGYQSPRVSCVIFLEKIGPKYFVRRDHFGAANQWRLGMGWAIPGGPQDLQVVSKLRPAIFRQIHSARLHSIEIEVRGNTRMPESNTEPPYCCIVKGMPEESWDAAGKRFLTVTYAFKGYLEVSTSAAEDIANRVTSMSQTWYLGLYRMPSAPPRTPTVKFLQFPGLEKDHAAKMASDAIQKMNGLERKDSQFFLQGVSLQAKVENVEEDGVTRFRVIIDCNHDSSSRSGRGLRR